jgi:NAD(P)-dependent dehydrogenase (short-subunit alcohol dehydrogenase family)
LRSLRELFDLHGRAALITGGAGHLALAIAEALAELGCQLLILDVDPANCEQRAADLRQRFNVEARGLACDLSNLSDAKLLIDQAADWFGRLDILINNAAFTGASGLPGYAVPFEQQSLSAWQAAMKVNIDAAFQLAQAAAPLLAASGHGRIINVASIYGAVGPQLAMYEGTQMGMPAAYAASKGALIQLTRYLATALAPNIRVNSISPGGIERQQPDSFVERYQSRVPLGRMGTEEDFKGVMAFLASDASEYVTGQNIFVDGGWTAW